MPRLCGAFFWGDALRFSIFSKDYGLLFLVCSCFVLFSFSVFSTFKVGYGWHDQQRIAQIFLLIICLGYSFLNVKSLPASGLRSVSVVLVLGFFSSMFAREVLWASMEWALYVGLFFLALTSASLNRSSNWRLAVACVAGLVGFFLAFQFLVYYGSSFLSGIKVLEPSLMYGGFANPRFLGQFQVVLIPLLAGLVVDLWGRRPFFSVVCLVVLLLHWVIAFMLDGRGVWVALFLSYAGLFIFASVLWRMVFLQASIALLGFFLFKFMFELVPLWVGIDVGDYSQLRLGLSARDIIWCSALEMAISHPWFGVGPMNFSAIVNPVAAHPHQLILQFFTEWGGLATLCVILLIVRAFLRGIRFIRAEQIQSVDVAIWLAVASALVLAQVDGVFVMPYAQTWLAVLVGAALGSVSGNSLIRKAHVPIVRLFIAPSTIILMYILLVQAPLLPEAQQAHFEKHAYGLKPRFWSQGWIPMEFND